MDEEIKKWGLESSKTYDELSRKKDEEIKKWGLESSKTYDELSRKKLRKEHMLYIEQMKAYMYYIKGISAGVTEKDWLDKSREFYGIDPYKEESNRKLLLLC
jgi:hypothetical protein